MICAGRGWKRENLQILEMRADMNELFTKFQTEVNQLKLKCSYCELLRSEKRRKEKPENTGEREERQEKARQGKEKKKFCNSRWAGKWVGMSVSKLHWAK